VSRTRPLPARAKRLIGRRISGRQARLRPTLVDRPLTAIERIILRAWAAMLIVLPFLVLLGTFFKWMTVP
jgi:hypothetical protein